MKSTPEQHTPTVVRFLDSFLQEGNIKWLLGVGTLILFSSSAMLVTSHWDSYPPLWKYAVLLAYTVGIHLCGQLAYHRLSLRKTGTGLMALTTLLIPLNFVAYRWVQPDQMLTIHGVLAQSGLLFLLAGNCLFSLFAAQRIFTHFLRKPQYSFLTSYLILSASGAVIPLLPSTIAPFTALFLWVVFAVGTIKVNRHAFWLTEEFRTPRIFGFFPIILLGVQFLLLFATMLAPQIPVEWIGLGLVLTAIPILQAADSLARVVQARSETPLPTQPTSVVLALLGGIAMVFAGVAISAYGFPSTVAIVPTSLLAAIVMGFAAHRTQRKEFVWLMILAILTTYQTSPVFMKQLVRSMLDAGSSAIGEDRMPIAFYGLTYLPLLIATSGVSVWLKRRGETFFAQQLQTFSFGLPLILLPLALTHSKMLFPVGLSFTVLFACHTLLFRLPFLRFTTLLSAFVATLGATYFFQQVFDFHGSVGLSLTTWIAAGGLFWFPGVYFDRAVSRIELMDDSDARRHSPEIFRWSSLGIVAICAIIFIALAPSGSVPIMTGVICFGLLFGHAFAFQSTWISALTLTLLMSLPITFAGHNNWSMESLLSLAGSLLVLLCAGEALMKRFPEWTLSKVFAPAANIVACIAVFLLQLILVPYMLAHLQTPFAFAIWLPVVIAFLTGAYLAWKNDAGVLVVATHTFGLVATGVLTPKLIANFTHITGFDRVLWIPVTWATLSTLGTVSLRLTLVDRKSADGETSNALRAIEWCFAATLGGIALVTIPVLVGPSRIAGLISVAGVLLLTLNRRRSHLTEILLLIGNAQLLVAVLQLVLPDSRFLFEIPSEKLVVAALPISLAAALSAWGWSSAISPRSRFSEQTSEFFQALSLGAILFSVWSGFKHNALVLLGTCSFIIVAGLQAQIARKMSQRTHPTVEGTNISAIMATRATYRAWIAIGLVLAAIAHLRWTGFLLVGVILSSFAPMILALLTLGLAHQAKRSVSWTIFADPLRKTATALPAATIPMVFHQHLAYPSPEWLGIQSLALLLTSGFYFWRGIERDRPWFVVASAAIFNVSLAIFWKELRWTDPQLFLIPAGLSVLVLVETLRSQIPKGLLNPLRYVGALTVLVSPTFQIVGGNWLHIITLMVLSLLILIVSMGLRIKALMYTGTAFLVADLLALVIRGTFDHPSLLWLTGIAIGLAVIGLAAYCERHREAMLQKFRFIAAELETWN
ncbi:hypothetical protein KOR42_43450 [Thalassoglobus neptunius]|uniref:DUF2157 domain-containing protein n=1 Tax=Thalassoglobus neptunius TaxID=1938619 RepID=A0A5C5W5X3_9PLAN|nr:hypothetical protein [Thalassoglobus neptunius]TWT46368.1 hypothetical protein KOR42_43450 [Thalassoglobus neptunius]